MASTPQIVPMSASMAGQHTSPAAQQRATPLEVLTIARRMFHEGFRKSVILRITGLAEEEYMHMIRDLQHTGRPSLV